MGKRLGVDLLRMKANFVKRYLDICLIILTCLFLISSIFFTYESVTFFMFAIIFLLAVVSSLSWRIHTLANKINANEKAGVSVITICTVVGTIVLVIRLIIDLK